MIKFARSNRLTYNGRNVAVEPLTDAELHQAPLAFLQRVLERRRRLGNADLVVRAEAEIRRRDPRQSWECERCRNHAFHEKKLKMASGPVTAMFRLDAETFHALICDYCGNTEFYNIADPLEE